MQFVLCVIIFCIFEFVIVVVKPPNEPLQVFLGSFFISVVGPPCHKFLDINRATTIGANISEDTNSIDAIETKEW